MMCNPWKVLSILMEYASGLISSGQFAANIAELMAAAVSHHGPFAHLHGALDA